MPCEPCLPIPARPCSGCRASLPMTPIARAFWRNEWDSYEPRFRTEAIAPILNKLGKVLADNRLRNIVAQPKSTIDLRRIMDEGRILIVNLAKGPLGEGT